MSPVENPSISFGRSPTARTIAAASGPLIRTTVRAVSGALEKICRAIAIRHVHRTEVGWQLTSDQRFVGRIEWDAHSKDRLPIVVIDGKSFTWDQVGHMLMTFEGFTLEAQIKDTFEVLGEEN